MPPPELMDEAKVEWGRISSHLHRVGLLTEIDRGALAACCQAYGRWVKTERILKSLSEKDLIFHGLVIKTSNGNMIQNPLVGTANKAMSDYVRYCGEFGMTPASRSRIDAKEPEEEDDDFA